ncbi:MAG: hypothetical protein COA78_10900 [Blastopirellula sp.]|nr:MAG: hypothetical protein COA78_10900 [Blastopirellula sp.]
MKCLQCNSERIVMNVRAVDREQHHKHDLTLEVYENPDAWVFKGVHEGVLKGNVCADCGFVMFSLSVSDAQKLERHQK